jgi:hypothetical protein
MVLTVIPLPEGWTIKTLETTKWIIDVKYIHIQSSKSTHIEGYQNLFNLKESGEVKFSSFEYHRNEGINEYYFDDVSRKIRFNFYWFM